MTIELKPIEEQVIVVTGASSGIGLATALTAAQQGAKVVMAARSEDTLKELVAQIAANGGAAAAVAADVSDAEQVKNVAESAVELFGRIDTWVNDAAVSMYGRLDQISLADARRLFDIDFWGVVNGSMVALPYLRRQGGAIINIGSELSDAVVPLQGMYTAAKHAVKGFTDALRAEIEVVDKGNVAVTLIQPTAVDTPFAEHARNVLRSEPKLPDDMIDAQQVADAILDAASHHRRDVKVGLKSSLNVFLARFIPSVADRLSQRYVADQQKDEPPRDPEGTLYRPGETGRVTGL